MPVTVRIPPHLRKYTEKRADVEVSGDNVLGALRDLAQRYPDLTERLFREDGDLTPGLNLFVNQDSIRRLDGVNTPVRDGDRIVVLLAMSGG